MRVESEMPRSPSAEVEAEKGGQFVALGDGVVLAAGKTSRDLVGAVQPAGLDRAMPTFEPIEPADILRAHGVPLPQ